MIYVALSSPLVLWVLFIAYTALSARWSLLRPEVKAVGAVVIACGAVIDIAFNWSIGLALGATKDVTFSQKCKRLKNGDDWRAPVARYICQNWLNVFQPEHC